MRKKKVLFICTHNSARSQMAEGLMNARFGDRYEAKSAGIEPSGVHPLAIRAMAELGIDISGHRSKSIEEFLGEEFDYVVTVCDHAKETCPFFPGARKYLHAGFPDPAVFEGTEEERLAAFRRVRDEIARWLGQTFGVEEENAKSKAPTPPSKAVKTGEESRSKI
ncbi:arsenate reductase ArsC [Candidatus Bipolaricaulota bacterium]|nr:arsenate reductase ArsC [Candidatus Bipolaricaulota bacterium]